MLQIAGAILLVFGAASVGMRAAEQLTLHVRVLREMMAALMILERELTFRATPMPELLEQLGERTKGPISRLFVSCWRGMDNLGERSLGDLWRLALEADDLPLEDEERETVGELGNILGRYDAESQREAVAATRDRLSQFLSQAEEKRDKMGRVYRVMGVTGGAFIAILLL